MQIDGMSGGAGDGSREWKGPMTTGRGRSLLRMSHIFSSTVRDELEAELLREISPHRLSLSQFRLLRLFALNGGHQVTRVAEHLGMSTPAASKNVEKLERLGLVRRKPSSVDRRASLLRTSRRGRALVRAYEAEKAARFAPVLESFTPEETERLTSLLERFSLALLRRSAATGSRCFRCAAYCVDDCSVAELRGGCPWRELRGAAGAPGPLEEVP